MRTPVNSNSDTGMGTRAEDNCGALRDIDIVNPLWSRQHRGGVDADRRWGGSLPYNVVRDQSRHNRLWLWFRKGAKRHPFSTQKNRL